MEPWNDPNTAIMFTLWILLLLLTADDDAFGYTLRSPIVGEDEELPTMVLEESDASTNTMTLMRTTLLNFRLCAALNVYHDEVELRVNPRSTTWFSTFLMQQDDSSRWVSMFKMTKPSVFALAEVIRLHIQKANTNYRLAVPVLVRVACTLFKLTHRANFTICSEMFAIGRTTVSKILREVVHAINDCLQQEIPWPQGDAMRETQRKFFDLCSLPAVVGAVDGVQFAISKLQHSVADYYYFKSGGYNMNCQAVVDNDERFLDLYVGIPRSTNDSRMLRRSSLFHLASQENFSSTTPSMHNFIPYLLGDSGYPLLPWLLVPHRETAHLSIVDSLFNRKLKKRRCVVKNAFGILKQSFRELLGKSELQVTFLPDVVVCCAILHNILLRQSHDKVEDFLNILQEEGLAQDLDEEFAALALARGSHEDDEPTRQGQQKRKDLGIYLTQRRRGAP